jgi:Ca2+-transporting ATPase
VWRDDDPPRVTVAAKGAPESLVEMCRLPPGEAARVLHEASAMAASGLRVLGVARWDGEASTLPDDARDFPLRFVALIGLADPLRSAVPGAMQQCRGAGVRVIMITGDYPATARAVAREAGLAADPVIVTGRELDAMRDEELRSRVLGVDAFARVVPAQKLRIVEALKAQGEVVAMTGDGVNDAPALKASHIGIAMGGRGTDVAREAAALVLLDDDFTSIVRAIRQGRRIFDNLRKAMSYLVSVHMPIAALGLLPVVVGGPLVLYPAHILFLEFIIDPACSIAFEAEPAEPDIMRRAPRRRTARLIGGRTLALALLEGAMATLFVVGLYAFAIAHEAGETQTRLLAFSAVIVANLSLIFFAGSGGRRVWRHIVAGNRSLWLVAAATVVAYAAVLAIPQVRGQFRLAAPQAGDAGLLALATACLWLVLAVLNWVHARQARGGPSPAAVPIDHGRAEVGKRVE